MLEAFVGVSFLSDLARQINDGMARQIELAILGGWYVLERLDTHGFGPPGHFLQPATSPILDGYILVGTAEDGGPLTKPEALAAKALLER